jgi:hypothetical protein
MSRGERYRDPVIEAYKKDVDRTLLRENLKRTPEERLIQAMKHLQFAEELRAAMQRARDTQRKSA